MTSRSAMKSFRSMPADSGAIFYAQQRLKYPFLDTLYRDSILPVLEVCSYHEIKSAYSHLMNTPVADDVKTLYEVVRSDLLDEIREELEEYNQNEQDMFIDNMLPLIDLGIDSIAQHDAKKTVSKYAGGILNFRKLFFMVGVNEKEFAEYWHKNVNSETYEAYLKGCLNDYCQMIVEVKMDYISAFTNRQSEFQIPESPLDCNLYLSSRITTTVADFTRRERNDLYFSLFKDIVAPALLSYVSKPITMLYETINIGYDVYEVTQEDLEEQDYDENMLISDLCSEDIENQIEGTAYPVLIKNMRKAIHHINQQTYNFLSQAL